MVVERVLVIGKTQPDWDRSVGDIVSCTVGITKDHEWRRLRHAALSAVRDLRTYTWADLDMIKPMGKKRDPRPESRELNPTVVNPIVVRERILDTGIRRGYVESCVQPSVEQMRPQHKTLGIIRPRDLSFEITKTPQKREDESQTTLFDFIAGDPVAAAMLRDVEWKKRYAEKPIEVRFKFYCGDACEKKTVHDMKVLDIELFMLYHNVATGNRSMDEAIELMAKKIETDNSNLDIYLGLGTHRNWPFKSYMVGSSMRFKKDVIAKPVNPREEITQ